MTAHYNYFFNAYDSYRNGIKRAESAYSYNYTLVLPMLLVGDEQVTGTVAADMDRTINKCTALINKHSITVKPQRKKGTMSVKEKERYNQNEFIRWAKKSWLLVGKAQAWKGDFEKAKLTLEHVLLRFPNDPVWFEAQIWLARISIVTGDYVDALDRLKSLEANRRQPKDKEFKHLLSSTWAFCYLEQRSNNNAIPYIRKAIDNAGRRPDRLRYSYILAQLLSQAGKNTEAYECYKGILKMRPPYEMAFSIRIKLIALSNLQGESLKKELLRLARDEKNRDYLDQLYYTLGNIEQQEGNTEKAVEYFSLSAKMSTSNSNQKGMSYLVLADYHFGKADYTAAQAYYDSSYNALDKNFPDYERIQVKTRYLNRLVENLNIIKTEDSLLRVANMTSTERNDLIAQVISKIQAEEEKVRALEQEERQQALLYQQTQRNKTTMDQSGGKWYFYNPSSVSFGLSEFQMKWGKRKLEDNWRRKNKGASVLEDISEGIASSDTSKKSQKNLSDKSPEYYLAKLPLTDSLKSESNKKIIGAMVKVAEVYQNDLGDRKEAKQAYLNLAERYPDNQLAASAYYNLYKLCAADNNNVDAQKYKSTLLRNYPQSPFALLLSNPNYVSELQQKSDAENEFYGQTYESYKAGSYSEALRQASEGLQKYKGTELEPKFALLQALCLGKTSDIRTFKASLDKLSNTFAETQEGKTALDMISYLNQKELQIASGNAGIAVAENKTAADTVTLNYGRPSGEHLFLLLVPKRSNINQLKFNLVSFNVDYFIETDLSVSNQPLNDFIEIISVSGFKDEKVATKYFTLISKNDRVFSILNKADYQIFAISIENFALFLNDKSVPDYLKFFRENYSIEK